MYVIFILGKGLFHIGKGYITNFGVVFVRSGIEWIWESLAHQTRLVLLPGCGYLRWAVMVDGSLDFRLAISIEIPRNIREMIAWDAWLSAPITTHS